MSTISQRLVDRAKNSPNAPAIRQFRLGIWEQRTWAELLSDAEALRSALQQSGVTKGDVVAVLSENSTAAVAFSHATLLAGAVLLVVPPDFAPSTTRAVLRAASAKIVLAGDQEQFDKIADEADAVESISFVVVDNTRGLRRLDTADRSDAKKFGSLGLFQSAGTTGGSSPASVDQSDRALLLAEVSGAAVELRAVSHADLLACSDQIAGALGLKSGDSLFTQRPLADAQELALTLSASPGLGLTTHIPGHGTETQGLRQVQPAALLAEPNWLRAMNGSVDQRAAGTTGFKKMALAKGLRRSSPGTTATSGSRLPKTRVFGLLGALVVLAWWAVSMSVNDVLRIAIALVLAALVGVALVLSGNAVADPLRRQLGLQRCRAVSVPSGSVGDETLGLLGAVAVASVPTPVPSSTLVSTVSSEVLS